MKNPTTFCTRSSKNLFVNKASPANNFDKRVFLSLHSKKISVLSSTVDEPAEVKISCRMDAPEKNVIWTDGAPAAWAKGTERSLAVHLEDNHLGPRTESESVRFLLVRFGNIRSNGIHAIREVGHSPDSLQKKQRCKVQGEK